eukprot:2653920-Rhodomonas_salina.1
MSSGLVLPGSGRRGRAGTTEPRMLPPSALAHARDSNRDCCYALRSTEIASGATRCAVPRQLFLPYTVQY